jgi:DHA2 family multidrug resistance protein
MTATDPAFQNALRGATQGLVSRGIDQIRAPFLARGTLYGTLLRQSSMLAYLDIFRVMAYACFGTLALLLFMKKAAPEKTTPAIH